METLDVIGFLTIAQWLAVLRIGIGLWWLKSVFHKNIPQFLEKGMISWSVSLAENHPVEGYGRFMKNLLLRTKTWFPYFQLAGEFAVGAGLIFGLLTPVSALAAIFMNLNFIALAGVKPRDSAVNPCFRVEQGQNWNMILGEAVILMAGAWNTWSLDGMLGLFA
jgi:thiosulfate dehydrogenase [quinone] large subunit